MTDPETPAELFDRGWRSLPTWNDQGPDVDARHAAAVVLIREAAARGHLPALKELADGLGGPGAFDDAIHLARLGDAGPLVSHLTSHDWPAERCHAVLDAARAGEAWAQLAVGRVYGLGMQFADTGVLVATLDDAFGWAPGVPDPDAEALAWITRAAEAGFAPAALRLATDARADDPPAALRHLAAALASDLLPDDRRYAAGLHVELLDDTDAPLPERVAARVALAEAGDAASAAWLGHHHRDTADLAAARAWYERAAAGGSVDGMRELGRLLEEGGAGPVDLDRARALYEQAAELGADRFARERLAARWGLTWYVEPERPRRSRKPKG